MTPAELEAWQKRLGFSQVAASRNLAVHPQTYRNWLAGRRDISPMIELLCQYVERHYAEHGGPITQGAESSEPDAADAQ